MHSLQHVVSTALHSTIAGRKPRQSTLYLNPWFTHPCKQVVVEVTKSPAYYVYPLTYRKQFNGRPFEVRHMGTASGSGICGNGCSGGSRSGGTGWLQRREMAAVAPAGWFRGSGRRQRQNDGCFAGGAGEAGGQRRR